MYKEKYTNPGNFHKGEQAFAHKCADCKSGWHLTLKFISQQKLVLTAATPTLNCFDFEVVLLFSAEGRDIL